VHGIQRGAVVSRRLSSSTVLETVPSLICVRWGYAPLPTASQGTSGARLSGSTWCAFAPSSVAQLPVVVVCRQGGAVAVVMMFGVVEQRCW